MPPHDLPRWRDHQAQSGRRADRAAGRSRVRRGRSSRRSPAIVIVLYSDGIKDQLNPSGEEYGRRASGARVEASCAASSRRRSRTQIFADLDEFHDGAPSIRRSDPGRDEESAEWQFHYASRRSICEGRGAGRYRATRGHAVLRVFARRRFWNASAPTTRRSATCRTRVCYAVKANSQSGHSETAGRSGRGFDIVSGGELFRVLKAGGDPAQRGLLRRRQDRRRDRLRARAAAFTASIASRSRSWR